MRLFLLKLLDLHFISLDILFFFFFFNDTATTEIYTLSLHDALPISGCPGWSAGRTCRATSICTPSRLDRKSTRLNSSHANISYAVFCLKKKTNQLQDGRPELCVQQLRHATSTAALDPPTASQCTDTS